MKEQLRAMLLRAGWGQAAAENAAQELEHKAHSVKTGVAWGGIHSQGVSDLWNRARASGAKRLTLCLEVEEDGYHTRATVLEREDFATEADHRG